MLLIDNTFGVVPSSKGDSAKPSAGVYNRLAVLRADRGLTRQQLAAALDINYQTVGFIERGDYAPSLELAIRICELFDLPLETVFSLRPLKPLSEIISGHSPLEATRG